MLVCGLQVERLDDDFSSFEASFLSALVMISYPLLPKFFRRLVFLVLTDILTGLHNNFMVNDKSQIILALLLILVVSGHKDDDDDDDKGGKKKC